MLLAVVFGLVSESYMERKYSKECQYFQQMKFNSYGVVWSILIVLM